MSSKLLQLQIQMMKKFKENFMKTNNEIEKILLNDSEYDKFVS